MKDSKNLIKIKERNKNYYLANKDKISKKNKEDYKNLLTKALKIQSNKNWVENNLEKRKKYNKEYQKSRRKNDNLFRLSNNLRSRLSLVFKLNGYKKNSTKNLLGCDFKEAKIYLESLFKEGMNWNNYGDWEIDHIIPLSSAKSQEELIKLCKIDNLQPLWKKDNRVKHAKITIM